MSPELRLVAACCRWPDDDVRRRAIVAAAAAVEDWSRVIALAEAHRVQGLVANGTEVAGLNLPKGLRDQMDQLGAWVRATALKQVGKTLQLSRAFAAAGIEHRVLKGIPLGVTVFGSPTLKHSWDIDLLVEPEQAIAAVTLLRQFGYRPQLPLRDFGAAELARWAVTTKELIVDSPDGSVVELHWRISDHPMLLTGLDARTPACDVAILGSNSVPTFGVAENLAYLAVHGAFHGWSRLKWLADYAALLQVADDAELMQARQFAPGRALDQAIVLSTAMFGTPVRRVGPSDPTLDRLVQLANMVIAARAPDREIERDRAAQKAIREAQWLLLPTVRYRALLALRWVRGSEDRKRFALPKGLEWAYWPMRPFTALGRMARRRLAGNRPG